MNKDKKFTSIEDVISNQELNNTVLNKLPIYLTALDLDFQTEEGI